MAKRATRRKAGKADAKPRPRRAARVTDAPPPTPARGPVTGVLTGMRDLGGQVGQVAVSVVRGSIKAAGQLGADVGRLAVSVADGAIETADRLAAAAGLTGRRADESSATPSPSRATPRRDPWATVPGREPTPAAEDLPANPDAYARRPTTAPGPAARKPLARSASRESSRAPAKPRRRAAR